MDCNQIIPPNTGDVTYLLQCGPFYGCPAQADCRVMNRAPSHRNPNEVPASPCLVGVEVDPGVIRTAVYSTAFELLGKMKLSAKPERGLAAVLERIERCVRYAIDECGLDVAAIGAIGIAVPGVVSASGAVTLERDFGWRKVPLKADLEARFGRPVCVANAFGLASWAVHVMENPHGGEKLGVLFPGATLAAGLVVEGIAVEFASLPGDPMLEADAGNVISRTDDPRFRHLRPRDIRKAIRKGDAKAEAFLRVSVAEGARFGARMVEAFGVRRLALAGGAVDENKSTMVAEAKAALASVLGVERAAGIEVFVSKLGDLAAMTGAAMMASRWMNPEAGDGPVPSIPSQSASDPSSRAARSSRVTAIALNSVTSSDSNQS